MHYFAIAGGYGPRTDIDEATERGETVYWNMIIPTSHWTTEMWELIHGAEDEKRYGIANHYSIGVHKLYKGACKTCFLSKDELPASSSIKHEDDDPVIEIKADDTWFVKEEGELWTHTSTT
jgi:hypothetical protein